VPSTLDTAVYALYVPLIDRRLHRFLLINSSRYKRWHDVSW